MTSYLILVSVVALLAGSIFLLMRGLNEVRVAKGALDEVKKLFDVTLPSRKKLDQVGSAYKKLQGQYKSARKKLGFALDIVDLYEVSTGSTDKFVFAHSTEVESIENLESRLNKVKTNLKAMVSKKTACTSGYRGTVSLNDSKAEANKYFNRDIKLRLQCLDREFLLAQLVIDWNNVERLKKRCELVFDEINQAGKLMKTAISRQYFDLKLLELDLVFRIGQAKTKLKELEREERAIEREAQREEERLKTELKRAERERLQMEKLVAREVEKLKGVSGDELLRLEDLKRKLFDLESREARAKSMSEITRSGHVYVISNPASFGDHVCKIGMTRRLDPMDRVKELGDASVPHEFKVHAFAYCADAPALEKKLHEEFEESRVNLINRRREFFYVDPSEVVERLQELDSSIELQVFPFGSS